MNLKSTLLLFAVLLFSCFDIFEPNFENIEEAKLRVIGSKLNDPNVKPGDTVVVTVVFDGNNVVDVYDFKMLYGFMLKAEGENFVKRTDYEPINIISMKKYLPDSIEVTVCIEDSIIIKQADHAMPTKEYAIQMGSLVQDYKKSNGTLFDNFTEDELDSVTRNIMSIQLNANMIFTALSENGTQLEVKKNIPITYRKEFGELIHESINPQITWIAVYGKKLKKDESFYPYPGMDVDLFYLYNRDYPDSICDSVLIKEGYSYFLASFSDTALGIDFFYENDPSYNERTYWFLKNEDDVDDEQDSLFVLDYDYNDENLSNMIGGRQDWIVKFNPPTNKDMRNFKIWVNLVSTTLFLRGNDILSCKGRFVYK